VLALLGSLGIALVVAEPAGAASNTLFVSATGTDTNPCSATAPCASVSHVLSLAVSGDTIEVAGHIFDSVIDNTAVTIKHWPRHAPAVIDASGRNASTITVGANSTLDGLTITGASTLEGGGVFIDGFVTVAITDSTITGNAVTGLNAFGGGVLNVNGNVFITDSTITGNTVIGTGTTCTLGSCAVGGGLMNEDDGNVVVIDSTITGNNSPGPGSSGGGVFSLASGVVFFGATIVSGNTGGAGNCSGIPIGGTVLDLFSIGYNLTDDTTGTACGFTQPTDKVNAPPDLGPLAFHGGPTETLLPAPNSPAVGVIPSPTTLTVPTLSPVPVCGPGAFDQRGVPRPSPGPNCTIGAVERRGAPATAVLVPSAGASVSGTSAVLDASASAHVTSVSFQLTGGPDNRTQIATAKPTIYGWIGLWNTTTVPNGTYALQSVASYADGVSGTSSPITITVSN
jgi:hypothetical protein